MGLLMNYLKNRWKEKRWLYVMDWVVELTLAFAFIYLSWQVRGYMLSCTCPFCQPPNMTLFNISNMTKSVSTWTTS
jgi:hypothetical protein